MAIAATGQCRLACIVIKLITITFDYRQHCGVLRVCVSNTCVFSLRLFHNFGPFFASFVEQFNYNVYLIVIAVQSVIKFTQTEPDFDCTVVIFVSQSWINRKFIAISSAVAAAAAGLRV